MPLALEARQGLTAACARAIVQTAAHRHVRWTGEAALWARGSWPAKSALTLF